MTEWLSMALIDACSRKGEAMFLRWTTLLMLLLLAIGGCANKVNPRSVGVPPGANRPLTNLRVQDVPDRPSAQSIPRVPEPEKTGTKVRRSSADHDIGPGTRATFAGSR